MEFKEFINESYENKTFSNNTVKRILELGDKIGAAQDVKEVSSKDMNILKEIQKLYDKLDIVKIV